MLAKPLKGATAADKLYIESVFSTYLYTGNGSTQTITNGIDLSGKGGLVWTKSRSNASPHALFNTNRGISKSLSTNSTASEDDYGNPPSTAFAGILSFDSSGYTLGNDGFNQLVNVSGRTYSSWTFRKAAKFFDVVTYTGNGSNRTIAHSLGSVPGCIIVKRIDSAFDWYVYHRSISNTAFLLLNGTVAAFTNQSATWNSTTPTSSVFSVGNDAGTNASGGTYVAYLFAHDAGGFGDSGNDNVISCGSYTGNGSANGPEINLGWEPQWVLIKAATGIARNWFLFDTMRGLPVGSTASYLVPNNSSAEITLFFTIDPTPTGFKIRTTDNGANTTGDTYIYIAIRRGPMKTPTDATKVFDDLAYTQSSPTFQTTNFVTDSVWTSYRNTTGGFYFGDRLRGGTRLAPNSTAAEAGITNFTWDSNTSYQQSLNAGGSATVIDYAFRRAPGFFDVVAYTGDGTTSKSISHNLGVVPDIILVKRRDGTSSWRLWSSVLSDPESNLDLEATRAVASNGLFPSTGRSSTAFVVASTINFSATYIAYLFATCPGVSKVGSYTGTGTTQQINCGFTNGARFVLIKRTDSTGDWYVWDTARGIVSGNDSYLLLNSTAAEVTSTDYIDPLSSGFELSSTAPAAINANGGSFIYLAVA